MAEQKRQARLRTEYAPWYPTIQVATWLPARSVARAVEQQLLGEVTRWTLGPRWLPGPRILDDGHFFFRGGTTRRDASARGRKGDCPSAPDAEQPPAGA